MIKSIKLKNFMSFKESQIDFTEGFVSISGSVGSGKSAILESVMFALFGNTRCRAGKQVIHDRESYMFVEALIDINNKDLWVKRSIPTGFECRYDGVQMSREDLALLLGMNGDDYLISTFFGMGSSDKLIAVSPTDRLNVLQKVAGADICEIFVKKSKLKRSEISKNLEYTKGQLTVAIENNESMANNQSQLVKVQNDIVKLREERAVVEIKVVQLNNEYPKVLDIYEEKHTILMGVRSAILKAHTEVIHNRGVAGNLNSEYTSLNGQIAEMDGKYRTMYDIYIKTMKDNGLDASNWVEILSGKVSVIEAKVIDIGVRIDLYSVVLSHKGSDMGSCPLCLSALSMDTVGKWKQFHAELMAERKKLRVNKSAMEVLQRHIHSYVTGLNGLSESMKSNRERIKNISVDMRNMKSKIDSGTVMYESLQSKMEEAKQADDVATKSKDEMYRNKVDVNAELVGVDRQIKDRENTIIELEAHSKVAQDKIVMLNSQFTNLGLMANSYDWISLAFSRSEIPLNMIKSVRNNIEVFASSAMHDFNYRGVRIVDSEDRGKMGVDFIFDLDPGRSRYYAQLSQGQKSICSLAVRLGLSKVRNSIKQNSLNFLLLDELAGHLSEDHRENLVTLLNKLMDRYKQIIVINHTPLRDQGFFNQSIKVNRVRGVTELV